MEIESGAFRRTEIAYPEQPAFSDPAGWDRWWLAGMAEGGITDLTPVSGTWLVPLAQLTRPETLRKVMTAHLADCDLADFPDGVAVLEGGLLVDIGEIQYRPNCCGSFKAADEWGTAAELLDGESRMIWLGHPWIFARGDGDRIQLSDYTELNEPTDFPYSVDREALRDGVAAAYTELADFARRIEPIIAEHVAGDAIDRVIQRLVYER